MSGGLDNTLLGRVIAHVKDPDRMRVAHNPKEGYCCALVNMGSTWNALSEAWNLRVFCSRRARDGMFCGLHDHFWVFIHAEDVRDYIARHGGRVTLNDEGEIVLYEAPSNFRKKPKVRPFEDGS